MQDDTPTIPEEGADGCMRVRKGQKGWTYYTYPLYDMAADHASAQPVFDLWRGKARLPRLPAWGDFAFEDFIGFHANLILYEVIPEPFDLYYRICGSKAAQAYGKDLTGQTMRSGAQDIQEDIDLSFYRELVTERRVGACEGPAYWRGRLLLHHAFLCLPLAENGQDVTHFITVLHMETVEKLP